jgi:hypothetical protein
MAWNTEPFDTVPCDPDIKVVAAFSKLDNGLMSFHMEGLDGEIVHIIARDYEEAKAIRDAGGGRSS